MDGSREILKKAWAFVGVEEKLEELKERLKNAKSNNEVKSLRYEIYGKKKRLKELTKRIDLAEALRLIDSLCEPNECFLFADG